MESPKSSTMDVPNPTGIPNGDSNTFMQHDRDMSVPDSPQAPPPPTFYNYTDVFLSDKYLKFRLLKPFSEEEAATYNRIQSVTQFFQEGCLVRSLVMGSGGGVLGLLFGTFFFTMKPVDIDTSLPLRQQIRQSYSGFGTEVMKSVKGFAKLGFLYSLFDCGIAKVCQCKVPNQCRFQVPMTVDESHHHKKVIWRTCTCIYIRNMECSSVV